MVMLMSSLEESKRKLGLMYGLKSIYLIRFRDNNCSREWISFFTTNENVLSARVIKEHCKHDGFEIHITEVIADSITKYRKRDA